MLPLFAVDLATLSRSLVQRAVNLLPIWLPLLVGAGAVFLLLPRPRAYHWALGTVAGVAALLLAGALLVHTGTLNPATAPPTILFYAFSAIAIIAGGMLVTQRNPARAALSFAIVVLSTCGLFLLLAAPFLMAATVTVYAGAIIVTFLFVLMLAQQEGFSSADDRSREPLLATITGFILLGALLYVLGRGYAVPRELDRLIERTQEALTLEDVQELEDKVRGEALNEGVGDNSEDLFAQGARVMRVQGWTDLRGEAERLSWAWALEPDGRLEAKRKHLVKLEELLLAAHDRVGMVSIAPVPGTAAGLPGRMPLSNMSGPPANTPATEIRRDPDTRLPHLPAENSAYLGRSLFTDFLLPVELGGTLLLVAAIGAIAIGQRRSEADRGAARNEETRSRSVP